MTQKIIDELIRTLISMSGKDVVDLHQDSFKDYHLRWDDNNSNIVLEYTGIDSEDDECMSIWDSLDLHDILIEKYREFLLPMSDSDKISWFSDELTIEDINFEFAFTDGEFIIEEDNEDVSQFFEELYSESWSGYGYRAFLLGVIIKSNLKPLTESDLEELKPLSDKLIVYARNLKINNIIK